MDRCRQTSACALGYFRGLRSHNLRRCVYCRKFIFFRIFVTNILALAGLPLTKYSSEQLPREVVEAQPLRVVEAWLRREGGRSAAPAEGGRSAAPAGGQYAASGGAIPGFSRHHAAACCNFSQGAVKSRSIRVRSSCSLDMEHRTALRLREVTRSSTVWDCVGRAASRAR